VLWMMVGNSEVAPAMSQVRALIFVSASSRRASVGPATVNRELATLRRMLRHAQELKEIEHVPRIRLLSGERTRILMLETGLRIGETLNLEWTDIILEPVGGARFGFLRSGRVRARMPGASSH